MCPSYDHSATSQPCPPVARVKSLYTIRSCRMTDEEPGSGIRAHGDTEMGTFQIWQRTTLSARRRRACSVWFTRLGSTEGCGACRTVRYHISALAICYSCRAYDPHGTRAGPTSGESLSLSLWNLGRDGGQDRDEMRGREVCK